MANPNYPWAANSTKLQVAISKMKGRLAENGPMLTEENIKAEYVRMGGLVLKQPNDEVKEEIKAIKEIVQSEPVIEPLEDKPIKKRGRPATNDKTSSQTPTKQKSKV